MKRKILIATTNRGKMGELVAMLGANCAEVEWLSLSDLPKIDEVVEDGRTFAENAQKKALGYAKASGLWTIADDSGLVVDALDGAPGINSARFAAAENNNTNKTIIDQRNTEKLLLLMQDVELEKRTARFVCSLCLADPQKVLIQTEGVLEGFITEEKVGENGFGYDPVVFVRHLNRTVAQLSNEEKNAISHRGNAIRKLRPLLAKLLQE